jgi:small subunit ribosomal protein S9
MDEYVTRDSDKAIILGPLQLTDTLAKYDIAANVRGGGIAGQAGAIRHGISRVLVSINPDLRSPLKKAEYLTRDPRKKERKKYGQPGARKRFQYSKR